jgi:hypothetical protein
MLHLKVTLSFNSDRSDKTWCIWQHFYIFGFYLPLINKCIYPLKFVKLLLKHRVGIRCG